MKKSLTAATGIAILSAVFALPSQAALVGNGGKVNGENLNGRHSGQAMQGLALDQLTISLPR
ncbi:MAG: hypothetical protein ABWY05_05015 [Noviherbaspirillum sp.]